MDKVLTVNADHGLDRAHTALHRGSDYRVVRRTRGS